MEIEVFIKEFLDASNAYDLQKYLEKWHIDAILNDCSVGRVFKGRQDIQEYFEDYFIHYKTQTKLISLTATGNSNVHIDVEFTGVFPEGIINGMFDFTLEKNKIIRAIADLV